MKRKFYETRFCTQSNIDSQMPHIVRFILDNMTSIVDTTLLVNMLRQTRTLLKTPMAEFFDRLVASEKLYNFLVLNIQTRGISVPELLTANNITIDLKQISNPAIVTHPIMKDKVVVNVTDTLRVDRSAGSVYINALDNFKSRFCRGALVASYCDADVNQRLWASSYINEFILKSYSMVISSVVGRYYNLSLSEISIVSGVCCYFMSQQLSADGSPILMNRCTWVGDASELKRISDACSEDVPNDEQMTLEQMVTTIIKLSPERMRTLDINSFVQMCGNLGSDLNISRIALEYAPYWLYCLIAALSGDKIPLVYQLNNQRLMNEGRTRLLSEIMSCESLFDFKR